MGTRRFDSSGCTSGFEHLPRVREAVLEDLEGLDR